MSDNVDDPAATSTEKSDNLYIVGIGASAGGLEALQSLIQNLPKINEPISFIIAQHLSPQHKSMLVELLDKNSTLRVTEAKNGFMPKANRIYVAPPNSDISFSDDKAIRLTKPSNNIGPKPSVDRFFMSLAECYGARGIGIILSGTGTDGAEGIRAIRLQGGITVAQSTDSSKYDGMPQAAINTDCVDIVLKPQDIGDYLKKVISTGVRHQNKKPQILADFETVISIVHEMTGTSFHGYKHSTLERRLERRMIANGIHSIEEYIAILRQADSDEVHKLAQDFLISVTSFFRDKDAFTAVGNVITKLAKTKKPGDSFRIWSVGCATGEETYSLAMLCAEALGGTESLHRYKIQIFGTDIDSNALNVARNGSYTLSAAEQIPQRLAIKYTIAYESHCEVTKHLRDIVLFSKHNVLEDPPFSRIDLIVCRNLLIYFTDNLQEKVFRIFHYAANPEGKLFLGKSESIGKSEKYFSKMDAKFALYQRNQVKYSGASEVISGHLSAYTKREKVRKQHNINDVASFPLIESLINGLAPNSILVDKNLDIIHIYGNITPYLVVQTGKPSLNLADIILPTFKQELRAFVYKSLRENAIMQLPPKNYDINKELCKVSIDVTPVYLNDEENLVLLTFRTLEIDDSVPVTLPRSGELYDANYVTRLEQELAVMQEHLQTVIEELETSNEEMQSLNEELQSSNEELHSGNEELETSNEELQSTNEELTTVNDELVSKKKELENSAAELVNIKNSITFPLLRIDENFKILRFNTAAQHEFNLSRNKELNFINHVPDQYKDNNVIAKLQQVFDKGELFDSHFSVQGKDYWLQAIPYRDNKNKLSGAILTYIDETDAITAKEQLRDTRARYDALASNSEIPIYIKDLKGKYIAANKALQNLYDRDEADILGRTDAMLVGKSSAAPYRKNDLKVVDAVETMTFEEVFDTKTGIRTYLSIKAPLLDRNGEVYATSGISVDISDRHNYLTQLKLYEAVFNNANDIILITKADSIEGPFGPEICYVNDSFCQLTGYTLEEVIGKTPRILQGEKTCRKTLDAFKEALKEHRPHSCELVNYGKDGKAYTLEINSFPIYDNDGEVIYFAAIQRDITERLLYAETLRQTSEAMQRASQSKSDFLANISHEIRTPMNAICGIADILENFELERDKQIGFFKQLGSSATQLKDLIDDVLDFSKLEAGQLEIHNAPFDIHQLLTELYNIHSIKAQERKLTLDIHTESNSVSTFVGDKLRIKQILMNLVSNALKFTDKGSVSLNVSYNNHTEIMTFIVKDTGIGISVEQQDKIFTKFSQGNISLDKKIGGTGLGLSITQSLINAMNGILSLESEPGKGSTFTMQLPMEVTNTAVRENHALKKITLPKPVLIVEDTPTNVDILINFLSKHEVAYHITTNGKDAINAVRNTQYSLILLDLQMHHMDGFETFDRIKSLKTNYIIPPVIALTAHAETSIRERCFNSGMKGFLTKPVDRIALVSMINKYGLRKL